MKHMAIEHSDKLVGIWTHDEVERRLREACATLRRLPMPRHGIPAGNRSNWPEIVRDVADRAGYGSGDGTKGKNTRQERDDERNRTRLNPTNEQIAEMDEALAWLFLIRDKRKCKVVFARSHVHEESGRCLTRYTKLAREMGAHAYTLRRWYRRGIRDICEGLSDG